MSVNTRTKLKLDVWKGDWGLPSIDLDCLRFMTYIKFSGLELEVNATSNPFWAPDGKLPVLRLNTKNITKYEDLVQYITSRDSNPDHGLSNKQQGEIEAFTSLMKEKLYPALQYVCWIDAKNSNGVIRPWYSKAIPFPFSFYYPGQMATNAQEMITTLYENIELDKDIEAKVYSDAQKCLTTLSVRLGDNDFMFGAHPTSIDATMFAFLAPLLKAPLQNVSLQNHLKACPNLHHFVSRINQRYYSKDYYDYENKRKEEAKSQQHKDSEFPHKTRNQLLAVLFAAIAMFSYALHAGIVEREPIEGDHFTQEDPYSHEGED
ncbi:metaxin-1 isoform X2 [Cimex lectularius]|uniref:Metaxin n=1 Tax=Cimex lectularius TaxID=79782 RepID=A0A8I6RMS0_CIMLE|nr:metaxin-1 isoform X2 [Cimex lectularius]